MRRYLGWMGAASLAAFALCMLAAPRPACAQGPAGRTAIRLPGQGRGNAANKPNLPTKPAAGGGAGRAAASSASSAKPQPPLPKRPSGEKPQEKIGLFFYGLDIDHLLRLLMEAAHVTIIKSDQVTGPFTILAPEEVPLDVAFQIVNSALEMRGFTMMKTDLGIYKVVPIAQAAQAGPPLQFGDRPEDLPPGDELITQVIPLKHLAASDIASQIRPLISDQARVVVTSTNSLIITDTASNLARVMTLINQAENELDNGYRVFHLEYYDAGEMANLVSSIVLSRSGSSGGGPRPAWERRVVGGRPQPASTQQRSAQPTITGPEICYPDLRTNSLIVLATPLHVQQIKDLIDQLDVPVSLRDTYYVYPVQNLIASDLAKLIGPLVDAEVKTVSGAGGSSTSRRSRTRPGTSFGTRTSSRVGGGFRSAPIRRGSPEASPTGSGKEGASTSTPDALQWEPLAGEAPPRPTAQPLMTAQAQQQRPPARPDRVIRPPAAPAERGAMPPPEEAYPASTYGKPTITADDNTNVLLISAPPEQMDLIKQLLGQLDVLPPQVHIQAIIAEVSITRDTSLGFQWEGLKSLYRTDEGDTFNGTFQTNFGLDSTDSGTSPSGFSGIITGPDDFRAVLSALTTDSHARILSTPGIFTTSGQPATINVSTTRPYPRGILSSTTSGSTISVALDRENVGIVLNVTPRVTSGDMVQMDVSVAANEVGAPVSIAGQEYPTTQERSADASIHVKSGYTVILGGLMRDTITRTGSRVPLLGDLPIVGALFRSTRSKREKSELLVFLTPTVVRTPEEAAQVTEEQKSKLPEIPRTLQRPANGSAPQEDKK